MDRLPILKKNAYLIVLVKDNYIFANLAYTDFVAQRTYLLSDITDLSPLKFRLDDIVFNKKFWFEYFNALEKEFDWDIVNREYEDIFKIIDFKEEGVGVSGIKVLVDDNQPFFNNIYKSIKEFSGDVVLRILDDKYIEGLTKGLLDRLGYDDVLWLDLDLSHFSIYRTNRVSHGSGMFKKEQSSGIQFNSSKIDWNNEIGLIDFIKSSQLQAFLSVDSSSEEISDKWANFVAHSCEYIIEPVVNDLLRAFTTVQNLSTKREHKDKLEGFGRKDSAIFVTGKLGRLLNNRDLLLSTIDGLELEGVFDLFVDNNNTVLTFGKSMTETVETEEILVLKGDILPKAYKVVIPEITSSRSKNKVMFSGKILSQDFENPKEIYALNPALEILKLPLGKNKMIVEGSLKNGAELSHHTSNNIEFLSSIGGVVYEYLVIDCRGKPIVYGPKTYDNKIKLKLWESGNKE
ncbi:hypothetical protein A2369_01665 [candidate division WS6 bacterium RIFOXYB1_FULL_33_15]|nr:MAG: hypothetical protein A2369_01665 [candidate division WS6 bacterium RIFOXYB1_FULL_33_15]